MRTFVLSLLASVVLVGTATAQTSGETETGTNNRGGAFVSQYVFYDWPNANLLTRYFWVNGAVNRAELAFGPTLKIGGTVLKLQFGSTTDREVMSAGLAVGKIAKHQVMYIAPFYDPIVRAPGAQVGFRFF